MNRRDFLKGAVMLGVGAEADAAGGEREVGITAYAVRMARRLEGKPIQIEQVTIERQCENEFFKDLPEAVQRNQAVVSFACGAGVQRWPSGSPGARSTRP
jgi:hypothetical protein